MSERDEAIGRLISGVSGLLVAVGAALVTIFLWQGLASSGSVAMTPFGGHLV